MSANTQTVYPGIIPESGRRIRSTLTAAVVVVFLLVGMFFAGRITAPASTYRVGQQTNLVPVDQTSVCSADAQSHRIYKC